MPAAGFAPPRPDRVRAADRAHRGTRRAAAGSGSRQGRRGRAAQVSEALPIEVDRGTAAQAPEPATDDSAQRFALLELDGAAPAA